MVVISTFFVQAVDGQIAKIAIRARQGGIAEITIKSNVGLELILNQHGLLVLFALLDIIRGSELPSAVSALLDIIRSLDLAAVINVLLVNIQDTHLMAVVSAPLECILDLGLASVVHVGPAPMLLLVRRLAIIARLDSFLDQGLTAVISVLRECTQRKGRPTVRYVHQANFHRAGLVAARLVRLDHFLPRLVQIHTLKVDTMLELGIFIASQFVPPKCVAAKDSSAVSGMPKPP